MLPDGADAIVSTSLDAPIQTIVQARLEAMLDGSGAAANVSQGAVVVLDPSTGAVLAMAGGRDHRISPYNRAVVARRQPGSSFKPFVWLAALEKGARPDDIVLDAPIRLGTWSPSNFDGKFRGEISLEEALAQSVNTASVRLVLQVGAETAAVRPYVMAELHAAIQDVFNKYGVQIMSPHFVVQPDRPVVPPAA